LAWIREWWPLIAFGMTLCGWIGREMFMYFKDRHKALAEVEKRVTAQETEHQAHEDICGRRYGEIAEHMRRIEETGDDRHRQLEKVGDERHEENLRRFDAVVASVESIRKFLMERRA